MQTIPTAFELTVHAAACLSNMLQTTVRQKYNTQIVTSENKALPFDIIVVKNSGGGAE